jgi:hypothetical protein
MPASITFMQKSRMAAMWMQQFAPYNRTTKAGQAVRDLGKQGYGDNPRFSMAGHKFTKFSTLMDKAKEHVQKQRTNELPDYKSYRFWIEKYHREGSVKFLGDTSKTAQDEWNMYLKQGTIFDQRVQWLYDADHSVQLIFVDKSKDRLKRMEAQHVDASDNDPWDTIWLRG